MRLVVHVRPITGMMRDQIKVGAERDGKVVLGSKDVAKTALKGHRPWTRFKAEVQ